MPDSCLLFKLRKSVGASVSQAAQRCVGLKGSHDQYPMPACVANSRFASMQEELAWKSRYRLPRAQRDIRSLSNTRCSIGKHISIAKIAQLRQWRNFYIIGVE
jgi:hypothetical protein